MNSINCIHCGKAIATDEIPAQCPHCDQDLSKLAASVLATIKPGQPSTGKPKYKITEQHSLTDPMATLESPQEAEARRRSLKAKESGQEPGTPVETKPESPLSDPHSVTLKQPANEKADFRNDSDHKTIQTPESEKKPTLNTPEENRRAAENYSLGLKTVIPPRTVSRADLPGELQDYKVEDWLGSGAFGVVFRAIQVPLDRSVAVKVLQNDKDESEARNLKLKNEFLREAQFTGKLEHPNIVPIHDIGVTTDTSGIVSPFYAMKEIRGESWLQSIRSKTRRENVQIFKQVANAIAFAHSKQLLHNDLKPDNVMLGEFGEVLVVDWGQAIDLSDAETMRPGGTPAYISPEMANYWCDIHLDGLRQSTSMPKVGIQSDIYLLGALLFEVVVGAPPHCNTPNEPPYEVIRRASENELIAHDNYVNDELMHIALCALRHGDQEFKTVEELLAAVNEYEARKLSIELRQRADHILTLAKQSSDYDGFQRAKFGYEESLEKWQGNAIAKRGLRDAKVSCAELSLKDQNFDLGIGMLDNPESDSELALKKKLVEGKKKRDRRKKLVGWLAIGLASSILLGIVVNAYMINENNKSVKRRDLALLEKDEALAEKQEIEASIAPLRQEVTEKTAELASTQKQISTQADQIKQNTEQIAAFPAKLEAEQEKYNLQLKTQQEQFALKAERDKKTLEDNLSKQLTSTRAEYNDRVEAVKLKSGKEIAAVKLKSEKELAAEQEKLVQAKASFAQEEKVLTTRLEDLSESSKLLRYKGSLTTVAQRVQAGDYRESRKLLDEFEDKTTWEWSRLNQLSHREVEAIYPTEDLIQFNASQNGKRFALVFEDRVEIRDTNQFNTVALSRPVVGASAIAFSPDGQKLAIGKPGDSFRDPGKIWIFDISNPASPTQDRILNAQSRLISSIEFSPDASRLLSVGTPSKARQSTSKGLDEPLMVWDENWKRIDVSLIVNAGKRPNFSQATFSADGRHILTTNPSGIPQSQLAHVFRESNGTFRWQSTSPISGINAAVFEDDAATEIVGCIREPRSGTFSLAMWSASQSKSTSFRQAGSKAAFKRARLVAQLEQKVLAIRKSGKWLVTSGQDKAITLWDWQTKTPFNYRGHSRNVDANAIMAGETKDEVVLISATSGSQPEILKTDLSTFRDNIQKKTASQVVGTDEPSLSSLHSAIEENGLLTACGNDLGQAAIERNGGRIQWDVSAWKEHVLTDRFLLAQSRDDYFYKYNRTTGNLESVLTKLRASAKIVKFEASSDGQTALVIYNDGKPEFQIWDLSTQTKTRTIDYGKENVFGTGTDKELLTFKLSPNGRWVVAGKVGVFVWSTQTGERQTLNQSQSQLARNAVSAINFLGADDKFIASWKDRVDLYDLSSASAPRRFNTSKISYSKNEPNILDARTVGGRTLILARATQSAGSRGGIVLVELESNTTLANFESARFASFSRANLNDVVVVNKPGSENLIERWSRSSGNTQPISLSGLDGIGGEDSLSGPFRAINRAFESVNGELILQSSTKGQRGSIARDWNTVSVNPSDANFVSALRVIAKPKVDFCGVANNRAVTLESGTIRFWNLANRSVQPDGVTPGYYRSCSLWHDGTILMAVPKIGNEVVGIDSQSGAIKFRLTTADSPVKAVFAHASNRIAIGNSKGQVEFWNVEAGEPVKSNELISISDSKINDISFSETGNSLVIVSDHGSAYVSHRIDSGWGRPIKFTPIDEQRIVASDISKNGRRIVTGTESGRLTIWNSETSSEATADGSIAQTPEQDSERELLTLSNQHQSPVRFAKFLTNAKGETQIVSAESQSGENQFLIWNVSPAN